MSLSSPNRHVSTTFPAIFGPLPHLKGRFSKAKRQVKPLLNGKRTIGAFALAGICWCQQPFLDEPCAAELLDMAAARRKRDFYGFFIFSRKHGEGSSAKTLALLHKLKHWHYYIS